ncbi:hypothetical protein F5144DRAFT_576724 [Chaetomium tenue]|uniref:Uncharacterized protein n=1 Tax=Chaetomium tenue TaxID=1854479 RepID=A0ACB7P3C8_9PEZI|nr:hypothetical protein F5144DRAFT_576724 [Chaetomium globosum]
MGLVGWAGRDVKCVLFLVLFGSDLGPRWMDGGSRTDLDLLLVLVWLLWHNTFSWIRLGYSVCNLAVFTFHVTSI